MKKTRVFFFILFLQSDGGENTTTFPRRRVGWTRFRRKIYFLTGREMHKTCRRLYPLEQIPLYGTRTLPW